MTDLKKMHRMTTVKYHRTFKLALQMQPLTI